MGFFGGSFLGISEGKSRYLFYNHILIWCSLCISKGPAVLTEVGLTRQDVRIQNNSWLISKEDCGKQKISQAYSMKLFLHVFSHLIFTAVW